MAELDNQIALVTGATRGIGAAIAADLGKNGAVVVGTATSEAGANTISEMLEGAGIQGRGAVLNVTDADSIATLLADMKADMGMPSILVNNAGITRDNLLMRMKEEDWDAVMDTNLKSVFRLSKACLRDMMKARHGRIINIASIVGVTGNAGQCNYASAKAGILGFTRSLAQEIAVRNITVNAVAPGFIDTDMTKDLPEEQKKALTSQIPMSRLGAPQDIADAVTFLASGKASYVTGMTMHVNGGMYMA